jgi:hypothetical protein
VGLTHARTRTLLPGLEGRAKPGIAKAHDALKSLLTMR